jgi:hypothetical protein
VPKSIRELENVDVLGTAYNLLGEIVEASNANRLSTAAKVQVLLAARL